MGAVGFELPAKSPINQHISTASGAKRGASSADSASDPAALAAELGKLPAEARQSIMEAVRKALEGKV